MSRARHRLSYLADDSELFTVEEIARAVRGRPRARRLRPAPNWPQPRAWPIVDRDLPAFAGELTNFPDRTPTDAACSQGHSGGPVPSPPGAPSAAPSLPPGGLSVAYRGNAGRAGHPTPSAVNRPARPASSGGTTRYPVRWSARARRTADTAPHGSGKRRVTSKRDAGVESL